MEWGSRKDFPAGKGCSSASIQLASSQPVLPDSSPSLERHPWERRPLDLCWWGGADQHACGEEKGKGHCLLWLS